MEERVSNRIVESYQKDTPFHVQTGVAVAVDRKIGGHRDFAAQEDACYRLAYAEVNSNELPGILLGYWILANCVDPCYTILLISSKLMVRGNLSKDKEIQFILNLMEVYTRNECKTDLHKEL